MATFFTIRDPNSILDYAIDWTEWLATTTDTISNSTWILPSALSTTASSFGTATTIVWISGGTAGEVYDVINQIVTFGGRTEERTIEFTCVDR
jgi:hypothetical protein